MNINRIFAFGTVFLTSLTLFSDTKTDFFTSQCLNSFSEQSFRAETEQKLQDFQKKGKQRKDLVERLRKAQSFRSFAASRRLELADSLVNYMRRRLDSNDKGMLLFAWISIEQLQVLDEYFDKESVLLERQLNSKPGNTFNVKDFGAKGDGTGDDGPAIRKAIDAALAESNSATVFLPAGTYRIQPINYHLQNFLDRQTDKVISWGRSLFSHAHLLIRNPNRITFAGEKGTKLLFTDPTVGGLRLVGSYNSRIRDLVIDYETLPFTQGKILGTLPDGSLEIEIDKGFPSPMLPNFLKAPSRRLTLIDPKTKNFTGRTFFLGKVRQISDQRFGVELINLQKSAVRPKIAEGMLFDIIARYDSTWSSAVSAAFSQFDEFERVTINASPAFGYFLQNEFGVILNSCRVEPAPGRMVSGNGDGIMNRAPRIGPCIENCAFISNEDDGLNITSPAALIESISEDGSSTLPKSPMERTNGVFLMDGNTAQIKFATRIVDENGKRVYDPRLPVENVRPRALIKNNKTTARGHHFEQYFPEGKVNRPDRLILRSMLTGTVISNTRYQNIRGLALQVTSPTVLVENCTIESTTGGGIAVTALPAWTMYFTPYHVIIRNNTISKTGGSAIILKIILPETKVKAINGILIEKNTLHSKLKNPILLQNCFDIMLRDNTNLEGKLLTIPGGF